MWQVINTYCSTLLNFWQTIAVTLLRIGSIVVFPNVGLNLKFLFCIYLIFHFVNFNKYYYFFTNWILIAWMSIQSIAINVHCVFLTVSCLLNIMLFCLPTSLSFIMWRKSLDKPGEERGDWRQFLELWGFAADEEEDTSLEYANSVTQENDDLVSSVTSITISLSLRTRVRAGLENYYHHFKLQI